jgi:hypothetical protein
MKERRQRQSDRKAKRRRLQDETSRQSVRQRDTARRSVARQDPEVQQAEQVNMWHSFNCDQVDRCTYFFLILTIGHQYGTTSGKSWKVGSGVYKIQGGYSKWSNICLSVLRWFILQEILFILILNKIADFETNR